MKLVVLATSGPPTDIMVNFLEDAGIRPVAVLIEPAQSRWALLRGRARHLGWPAVFGQVLFMTLVLPYLRRSAEARLKAIRASFNLRADPLPQARATYITSVNAPETRTLLQRLAPDVVVLSGTRIVKANILQAIGAPVLNIHAGITPDYRGVHGGYWALHSEKPQDFGATLHLVDPGVDTGDVLEYARTSIEPHDNFATYPLLQLAVALPALVRVLDGIGKGEALPDPVQASVGGQQWYHPTLRQYLSGLWRGVK